MYEVTIYTDGACSGNPGPAGIGAVLVSGDRRKEIMRAIGYSTNNVAEIQAVVYALQFLRHPERTDVTLFTDSQLVCGLLGQDWKAKANQELVALMRYLAKQCAFFRVVKVKAHNGDPLNERAHALAREALEKETH